ncbi:MAG: hypothetical protein ACJZ9F_05210 [Rhodospirillaceae bacterium]
MPRKPNYRFDRMERDRQKAAKKAERLKAKRERSDERKETGVEQEISDLAGPTNQSDPTTEVID